MDKLNEATKIVNACMGRHGAWASGDARYAGQCWTRDFGMAVMPLMMRMGRHELAERHLKGLEQRQRSNGRVPILFLDGALGTARFLSSRLVRTVRSQRLSFMLKRWLQGELWDLTPGTRDSELHYCCAALEFSREVGRPAVHAQSVRDALGYIERELVVDGLVTGCDWRDTMHLELQGEALLTNNSVLLRVYDLMQERGKAKALRARMREMFWHDDQLLDYPNAESSSSRPPFDPLGASLAVLHGAVEAADYPRVMAGFRLVDTPCGVTIRCRHNPVDAREALVIEATDGEVVWPFVVGFTVMALVHMSRRTGEDAYMVAAQEQMQKLEDLPGFYEWYDPRDGTGCGAQRQMWSAALYVRARQSLGATVHVTA